MLATARSVSNGCGENENIAFIAALDTAMRHLHVCWFRQRILQSPAQDKTRQDKTFKVVFAYLSVYVVICLSALFFVSHCSCWYFRFFFLWQKRTILSSADYGTRNRLDALGGVFSTQRIAGGAS
jgi:hypothetical protein